MSEATTNVVAHAYLGIEGKESPRWWLFTQTKDGYMYVALCDLGIGIPESLRKTDNENSSAIKKIAELFLKSSQDHHLIEAAFELGKTSTKNKNQGKGMKDILSVVESVPGSSLMVFSGRGYHYRKCDETGRSSKYSGAIRQPVRGTLICWRLQITEE